MAGIVGNVALIKSEAVAEPMKRAENSAIRRGMTVAPGRRQRQAEEGNFQCTPSGPQKRETFGQGESCSGWMWRRGEMFAGGRAKNRPGRSRA